MVLNSSASLLRAPAAGNISPQPAKSCQPPPGAPPEGASAGLDGKLQALAQLFELASTTMHVDQPVCLDCAAQLKDEIEAQVCVYRVCVRVQACVFECVRA